MKKLLIVAFALASSLMTAVSAEAQVYTRVYSREDAPLIDSSSGTSTSYYVSQPATTGVLPAAYTTYYSPYRSYYAPYTAYYGGAPVAAPVVPYTSYYAAPYTSYYAPSAAAVPYGTYYAPAAVPYYSRPYVPGQPVRNWMRGY